MGKLPFMKFFPMDFDRDMAPHPLDIRGAWITIINHLWNSQSRGTATYNSYQWARILGGITLSECERVINYLKDSNICEYNASSDGRITIGCRRILKEEEQLRKNALRQARLREKGGGDPDKWTSIRVPILQRDGYMCAYCGRRADTVDHIIPKSKGGTEDDTNLVACCMKCNRLKSNRNMEEAKMSFWPGFDTSNLNNAVSDVSITPKKLEVRSQKLEKNKYSCANFDSFWNAYPRKIGKAAAFKKWQSLKKNLPSIDRVLESIETQKQTDQWKKDGGQFIPHPATWLNQGRWDDEIKPEQDQNKTTYVICPNCKKEIWERDLEGQYCIHCMPRKPLNELLGGI